MMSLIARYVKRLIGRIRMNPNLPKEIPIPNLWSKLLTWIVPNYAAKKLASDIRVASRNYKRTLKRITEKSRHDEKIRVIFLVQTSAKWKCKTVYNALKESGTFDPVIGIAAPLSSQRLSPNATLRAQQEVKCWFEERGYATELIYDALKDKYLAPSKIGADFIFFPEASFGGYSVAELSKYSLVCYVQYYVPNYWDPYLDCGLPNHRLFYRFFALNKEWIELYRKTMGQVVMAGKFEATGHPMLDLLGSGRPVDASRPHIIYAPHWSFTHPKNPNFTHIGTFTWSGNAVLEYAKQHTEFNWTFKPHPGLLHAIVTSGLMTEDESNAYYNEWVKIGESCTTGDYADVFYRSSHMITDCASFLSEYGSTGKPIIRLVSQDCTAEIPAPSADVIMSYYQVHNAAEFFDVMKMVERGEDPKRDNRIAAVKKAGLFASNAGYNICNCLENLIRGN